MEQLLTKFIELLKELFPTLLAFKAGRDSKENQNLKAENDKLKKYQEIDGEHINLDDVYDDRLWK